MSSKKKKLYIHIGGTKTGSSSIQVFLKDNASVLRERYDLDYPSFNRPAPGRKLKAYIEYPKFERRNLAALGPELQDPERFVKHFEATFERQMNASKASRVVISSELLAGSNLESIQRLKNLVDPFFEQVVVIYYIRRQDRHALSLFLQAHKLGMEQQKQYRRVFVPGRHKFRARIENWAQVFGKDAMNVRLYERDRLPDGDVVADLRQVTGIDSSEGLILGHDRNSSWDARQIAVARVLNPHFNVLQPQPGKRKPVRNLLLKDFINGLAGGGPKYLPARKLAREHYEHYREENEWIRKNYFPDQEKLFDESFDSYPEEGTPLSLSQQELEEVLVELWAHHEKSLDEAKLFGAVSPDTSFWKQLRISGNRNAKRLVELLPPEVASRLREVVHRFV